MSATRWIAVLSIAAVVVTACGTGGGSGQEPAGQAGEQASADVASVASPGGACTLDEPVKVGVVFSQTGGAAVYGTTQLNGVQLAADQQNADGGVSYELVVEDDASDPAQGITAFEKLINQDEVSVIIGPTLSNTAFSTDPVAQDAGVPVLGVSNTADGITEIGDFVWRNSLSEAQVIPQTVEAAVDTLDLERVAVFYGDDDSLTVSTHKTFVAALEEHGVEIVTTQTFAKGDTDFAPQLTAAKKADPDALIVAALAEEGSLILQQARELGLDIPVVGGNGFNSPAVIEQAGEAAEGVVVGAAWNSAAGGGANEQFIADYKAQFGSAPDQFAAQAYAGMNLVATAVEAACSADREAIRDGFDGISGVETVLGEFSFTDGRDADHVAVVQIIEDGRFQVLD